MSKKWQHDRVKPRGGGQGPFTQCVKKHPIWQRMASLSITCQVILGRINGEKAFVDSYHSAFDQESCPGL